MVNYITIHNSVPCHCEPKYYIKGKEYTKEQYDSLIYRKESVKKILKVYSFVSALLFRTYVFLKYKI